MLSLNRLAAVLLPIFLMMSGCAGTGVSDQNEMLRTASTKQANTAIFFWENTFISGLERMAFYQDDVLKGSISKGQVMALQLEPGDNQFSMSWEEALELPVTRKVAIRSDPNGPSYYLITESYEILTRYRGVQPVSKEQFFQAINKNATKEEG